MHKITSLTLVLLALFFFATQNNYAEEASKDKVKHAFVGVKKCKTCHKDKFKSWSQTPHAKTFDLLSDDEKKKPECIKCHTTGSLADGTLLMGTQCEACHGAGKDYKSIKIMSKKKWKANPEVQKKLAIEAGLVYPTEETCKKCHTKEGNPNYKEFDFATRKDKVHPVLIDSAKSSK